MGLIKMMGQTMDQRVARVLARERCTDNGPLTSRFTRRQNIYFGTEEYIDCCHTQTKTQHKRLTKCNKNVQNIKGVTKYCSGCSGCSGRWTSVVGCSNLQKLTKCCCK